MYCNLFQRKNCDKKVLAYEQLNNTLPINNREEQLVSREKEILQVKLEVKNFELLQFYRPFQKN